MLDVYKYDDAIFNQPEELAKQVKDGIYLRERNGEIYVDVYKHKRVVLSQEFTNETIEAVLFHGIQEAKKKLDDEITYSHPTSEYKMVICKKDFN